LEAKKVDFVINEALRVGKKVIVGFPNFAYWSARLRLSVLGKAPVTASLPYRWYNTPNLHFLSTSDFRDFCAEKGTEILDTYYLGGNRVIKLWPNLFALNVIFVIRKKE